MAQSSFSHLNEFCAAGAMAAQARRAERERRENLLDAGVCDDAALWPSAIAEVDDVHFIDASWLTEEFMASLPDARGNGRRGASTAEAHGESIGVVSGEAAVTVTELLQAFDDIIGDAIDESTIVSREGTSSRFGACFDGGAITRASMHLSGALSLPTYGSPGLGGAVAGLALPCLEKC